MRTPQTGKALSKMTTFIRKTGKALDKMPSFAGVVYRGLDVILTPQSYPEGEVVCWQAFSSSTKSLMQTVIFLSVNGHQLSGTLIVINSINGREVELMSQFPHEEEVLFTYNTFFHVVKWVTTEAEKRALLPNIGGYDISNLAVLRLQEM
jgi:hypothetical protein